MTKATITSNGQITIPKEMEESITEEIQKSNDLEKYSHSKDSFLHYAGSWVGDDGEECLEKVYNSRGLAEF